MSGDVEQRMIELETRQAFQDDALQALSDVLVVQQRQMERLQRQLEALAARQEVLQSQLEQDQIEPPPPHY